MHVGQYEHVAETAFSHIGASIVAPSYSSINKSWRLDPAPQGRVEPPALAAALHEPVMEARETRQTREKKFSGVGVSLRKPFLTPSFRVFRMFASYRPGTAQAPSGVAREMRNTRERPFACPSTPRQQTLPINLPFFRVFRPSAGSRQACFAGSSSDRFMAPMRVQS